MSADPENEYLSDGLTEELINALTKVKGLRVAARTSVFFFKNKEMDIREIGRKLNVQKVLEGSVRITVQLINVADGFHIWSERFDSSLNDIFAIQDEISLSIVEKLKLELLEGEKENVVKRHTYSQKAYDLFLKGRYFWNRRLRGDMIKAVSFYQKAIDKDAKYALPYVGIADAFYTFIQWAFIHPQDAYSRAKAMLQKALEINQSLGELYASLANLTYFYMWDFKEAEKHFLRSIELNPNNPFTHVWYGHVLTVAGRFEEGLNEIQKAIELAPMFTLSHTLFGLVLAISGHPEKGRQKVLESIAMESDQPIQYFFLPILLNLSSNFDLDSFNEIVSHPRFKALQDKITQHRFARYISFFQKFNGDSCLINLLFSGWNLLEDHS
jgi:adenylate cyclase